MAAAKRIKSALLTLLAVLGILLWLIALLSFTRVTENTDDFARRLDWILLINTVGIAVMMRRTSGQKPMSIMRSASSRISSSMPLRSAFCWRM